MTCGHGNASSRSCAECRREYNTIYQRARRAKHRAERPVALRTSYSQPTTPQQARAAGLTRYIGSPCKRGHAGERYASTSNCVECARAASPRLSNEQLAGLVATYCSVSPASYVDGLSQVEANGADDVAYQFRLKVLLHLVPRGRPN